MKDCKGRELNIGDEGTCILRGYRITEKAKEMEGYKKAFEEMKEWIGQPVWDNKERRYRILEFVNSQWVTFRETLDHTISEGFKGNRFYRREVKE